MAAMTPEQAAFWRAFQEATGETGDPYAVDQFGDSPEMADALIALALSGRKRASASLARWYGGEGPALPKPGNLSLCLDGKGAPACVIRTTEVEVKPIRAVDAAFAHDEGEGDRSLAYWLREHRAFFQREARREGFVYSDDLQVVCERFEKIWP